MCSTVPVDSMIRHAEPDDLDAIASLAADAQRDPERACAYLGDDADAIAADVADVDGPTGGAWTSATWVTVDHSGGVVAWLLAETDPEMGRVWWWGPVLADAHEAEPGETADRLLDAALAVLKGFDEHELALDGRSTLLAAFAERHGFTAETASVLLATAPFDDALADAPVDPAPRSDIVVAIDDVHRAATAELHDAVFPGTHTPGASLVARDAERELLVIEPDGDPSSDGARAGAVAGYVATELQNDGSLYIDYLGVSPEWRGRGLGRLLVSEAVRRGAHAGASHAHLTVRQDNTAARRLYASIGFAEVRILVPYRRGFSIE